MTTGLIPQYSDEGRGGEESYLPTCLVMSVTISTFVSFPLHIIGSLSTLSLPESLMLRFKVVLTFETVDEILWCDHSNETILAVLSHGSIYI